MKNLIQKFTSAIFLITFLSIPMGAFAYSGRDPGPAHGQTVPAGRRDKAVSCEDKCEQDDIMCLFNCLELTDPSERQGSRVQDSPSIGEMSPDGKDIYSMSPDGL